MVPFLNIIISVPLFSAQHIWYCNFHFHTRVSGGCKFPHYCCCTANANDWLSAVNRAYDQPAVQCKFAIVVVFFSMDISYKGPGV